MPNQNIGVWFPAVRCGSGVDFFTEHLCEALNRQDIRAEITWLPHRAEYAPWTVRLPKPPEWATVTHVNTWLPARFLSKHVPIVATVHHCVHDPEILPYKGRMQNLYHRFWIYNIEIECLRRAQRIIAVSRFTATKTKLVFNIKDLTVIHNGIDCNQFVPLSRSAPHSPFHLLYVGNWSLRKGVDLIGPIMEQLGPDFELRYTIDSHGYHHRYRLPSNCKSLGRLSRKDLIKVFQNSDALILPSRLEGFGLVVAEAMACGVPAIATCCSALPEVVENGVTGFLCQHTVEDFVKACRKVTERDIWLSMHTQARERAVRLFNEDDMASNYIRIYNTLY
ncbi:MAG: glycosyltransferase family 4 protein [Deltaproteobacteria bacterium]|nr:glycosyltransferase family 4 protein [Deltaproteobacteria bacterium]